MLIAKIRKPFLIDLSWVPYTDWLWVSKVTISDSYVIPDEYVTLGYPLTGYNTTTTDIGQCYVDNVSYDQTASIASCIAIEKSWFFDIGNQLLYVHPDHAKRMDATDFDSLETRIYSNDQVYVDANNFTAKPYMTANIKISDEVDRGEFSKMSFVSNTLTFFNQANYDGVGEFDYAFSSPVPGADVDILYISQEDLDAGKKTLTPLYSGYVESETITRDKYTIKVADKREQLNGKYPNIYFDSTTYPDMEDDIDELIPDGYGDQLGCPAFCTNDTIESGDVTYKYATDGTSLTTVYVYDDEWIEVTPSSYDAEECTFTLSTTDGRSSSGSPLKSKVNCRLRNIDNPSAILVDLLKRDLDYPFNADYFDFQTWTEESALLGDVSLYRGERKTFFSWVELLQNGSTIPFIFRVNADGKFQVTVDDITREIGYNYESIENMSDERSVTTDFTQYATDLIIYYSLDQNEDEYKSVTLDTYKTETIDTYRLEQELEYETLLTSEANAIIRGNNQLKDYKKARPKHTIKLRGIIPTRLLTVLTYDSSICLRGVCNREYAGTVKLKIASYSYDFQKELTTLTGYDISDIISKGTEVFTQGIAYGSPANGTFANSNTGYYTPEVG